MLRIRIRDPVSFWPPGPKYFWELSDKSFGKKFYNSLKTGSNFFLQHFKNKIISILWNLWLQKKLWQQICFHPSLLFLFLDPGSGMGKIQDPGSGINIPDPHTGLQQGFGFLRKYVCNQRRIRPLYIVYFIRWRSVPEQFIRIPSGPKSSGSDRIQIHNTDHFQLNLSLFIPFRLLIISPPAEGSSPSLSTRK